VIGKNNNPTGYAGCVDKKITLLSLEGIKLNEGDCI
jgi:O6-methylguanine-DNA--protein-cysteine methyltransferase